MRLQYCGRIFLLLYLMISAITPLSTVHVEDQVANLNWAGNHAGSGHERVLVRLHEMLFRHFSDRSDHVAFSRGYNFERSIHNTGHVSRAACPPALLARQDYDEARQVFAAYSIIQDGIPLHFDAIRLFYSDLSPPAA